MSTTTLIHAGSAKVRKLRLLRLRKPVNLRPSEIVAIVMLVLIALLIIVVPFLPGYSPYTQNISEPFLRPFTSWHHLLGTDELGRDNLSRLALGGRVSLTISVIAMTLNLIIGVTLGLLAGYFGGVIDNVIMGFADLQLSIPLILLLIAIVAALGPSSATLVVVIGLTFWVGYARIARTIAVSLREREFVLAAITQGATSFWILRKHLLPNVVPQLVILGAFNLGFIVTLEASLDFLGLGVQVPTPTWGGMISDAQNYLQSDPWMALIPGVAMFMLIGGVQFLSRRFTAEGESPRAILNPGASSTGMPNG